MLRQSVSSALRRALLSNTKVRINHFRFNDQFLTLKYFSFKFCTSRVHYSSVQGEVAPTVFPGIRAANFVSKLQFIHPESYDPIPIYRIMDSEGNLIDEAQDPKLSKETVHKCFRDMVLLNAMDKILYESQRQGRISFYMTNFGEEASHIGSACALTPEDLVYAQYREAGVLVWRGFTISEFVDQCYGNVDDQGKGSKCWEERLTMTMIDDYCFHF
jgi:2-oxoisovalerate dehydrogenase E1 component alpha subunit